MSRAEDCVALFRKGYNCAQALLGVYGQDLGLDRETGLKAGSGFGGGLGSTGHVCGALTGAVALLSLRHGSTAPGSSPERAKVDASVQEFVRAFKAECGVMTCRALIRRDISTEEKTRAAARDGVFARCPEFVRTAAEIVEPMLGGERPTC